MTATPQPSLPRDDEPPRLTIVRPPEPTNTTPSLAARLERRFGLGAMPAKRRALYIRLQCIVDARPELEALVREAASQAAGKDHPDRYFCRAITAKLREARVYEEL